MSDQDTSKPGSSGSKIDEQKSGQNIWRASVVTLFPEMFPGPLGHSLAGQALQTGIWSLETTALRPFGLGKHHAVDDTPAGGGAGMVIRADVLGPAIDAAITNNPHARHIFLSPRGRPLNQALAHELAETPGVLLVAGRFEGVDQRIIDHHQLEEISIGDYVLSGGELAAMVLLDAIVRLLPGVVGANESLEHESFETGHLEHPQYTRPRSWQGRDIPDVLLSGDHGKIAKWREAEAQAITRARRPDLIKKREKRK